MKIIKFICIVAFLGVVSSCNDGFLERYPLASLSPETYFRTEAELKTYTNAFYGNFPDVYDLFHNGPVAGDDESNTSLREEFRGVRVVPASGSGWDWTALRRINFFLENSSKCTDERVRARYDGLARFFRTWFYLEKIKRFGDVPWYDFVMDQNDERLYKARDSREVVFNHMMEDINYAIANLPTTKHTQEATKWTALALKSRMCLFEGTFRKYHGLPGWEAILRECVSASDDLITNSGYRVYTSTKDKVYQEMFVSDEPNSEMILALQYNHTIPLRHGLNFYTLSNSYGRPGVNRSLINSYLKTDGSRFTDTPNYVKMQWYEEMQNRDPRLTQTVRGPGHIRVNDTKVSLPVLSASITGYQWTKFVTSPADDNSTNVNDISLFRYAEVLLNYAEAKAELGDISQADIDKSIKLLRDRVGMPNLIVADANQNPDPYIANQYPRVTGANKGIILEIRRERRIELVREGFRYYDIIRWKEGQLFERVWHGMYFPGLGEYDLDHDGVIDLVIYEGTSPPQVLGRQYQKLGEEMILENGTAGGQILTNSTILKKWDENKDYLYPIPTQDRQLNKNLTQNPNWPLQ